MFLNFKMKVEKGDVAVRMFPGNVIANLIGYKPATEYFKAEEKAKAVPEVKF